jgi:hypothetical protein
MTNRREIIQAALSAAAVLPAFKAFAGAPADMPLFKVLYDQRSEHGLMFAAQAARQGAPVHATRGDVTGVWFDELQPCWKSRQGAVAGLTDFQSLFVLDMMARDAGMRAVYIAAHRSLGQGAFEHRLFGPRDLVRLASREVGGNDWPGKAARIVTHLPDRVSVAADQSTIAEARNHEMGAGDLVSWVIAAASKA